MRMNSNAQQGTSFGRMRMDTEFWFHVLPWLAPLNTLQLAMLCLWTVKKRNSKAQRACTLSQHLPCSARRQETGASNLCSCMICLLI